MESDGADVVGIAVTVGADDCDGRSDDVGNAVAVTVGLEDRDGGRELRVLGGMDGIAVGRRDGVIVGSAVTGGGVTGENDGLGVGGNE